MESEMAVEVDGLVSQGMLNEERLLVERARCNREAFGDLYTRYSSRVYAYAYKRTGSRESAEDITSNTFVLALEGIGKYEWRNVPFSAWLFRIAANQVAMHYRKARPCLPIDGLYIEDQGVGPETEAVRASEADTVRDAVAGLNRDQQRAIYLRYNSDMRAREIAAEMGRTEGSVKLLLHRATATLRSRMLPMTA